MSRRYGVFDIMGPVMVGPSSSHTAGAARLGMLARLLCGGEIQEVEFLLHGSFAETYRGHGTDKALLAGLLGIDLADERLCQAYDIAEEAGLAYRFTPADLGNVHPNTVCFHIKEKSGQERSVTGSSIGGGSVVITEIDGIPVNFTGENPILVTKHRDEPGVVSRITTLLYECRVNIGNMRVIRAGNGTASMYMELDSMVPGATAGALRKIDGVLQALLLDVRLHDRRTNQKGEGKRHAV